MQQLREAQREAEELRVAHSSSAEDGMAHVSNQSSPFQPPLPMCADPTIRTHVLLSEMGCYRMFLFLVMLS